jgi:hypothetical protein
VLSRNLDLRTIHLPMPDPPAEGGQKKPNYGGLGGGGFKKRKDATAPNSAEGFATVLSASGWSEDGAEQLKVGEKPKTLPLDSERSDSEEDDPTTRS